jgi:hypothetical protein
MQTGLKYPLRYIWILFFIIWWIFMILIECCSPSCAMCGRLSSNIFYKRSHCDYWTECSMIAHCSSPPKYALVVK